MTEHTRCEWAEKSELECDYHDQQWGVPMHDDHQLFKMLMLEGMQAGLSWSTILKKMDSLCEAFDDFDPNIVQTYQSDKVAALLQNPGIIRNKLKINAVITNAKAYFALCEAYGSLNEYLWQFVSGKPIINQWHMRDEVPAHTELSDRISKDLKRQGFKFVGTTIVYAFMQSIGMVNDHIVSCPFKYRK